MNIPGEGGDVTHSYPHQWTRWYHFLTHVPIIALMKNLFIHPGIQYTHQQ